MRQVTHQGAGTSHGISSDQEAQSLERFTHRGSFGLHKGCSLSEGGALVRSRPLYSWVLNIQTRLERRDLVLSTCHITGVVNEVTDGLISWEDSRHRMGYGFGRLRMVSHLGGYHRGSLVCHSGEHETHDIYVSSPGSACSSRGCL